jgi:hypothetical protein
MIDLGSLSRTMSHWINDDSVSDDRNRKLRLGANHFIPTHYLFVCFIFSFIALLLACGYHYSTSATDSVSFDWL